MCTQTNTHTHTHTEVRVHAVHTQRRAGAGIRSQVVSVTGPLPSQCFRLAVNAKRPRRQSALLPSSRRLKLRTGSVETEKHLT